MMFNAIERFTIVAVQMNAMLRICADTRMVESFVKA